MSMTCRLPPEHAPCGLSGWIATLWLALIAVTPTAWGADASLKGYSLSIPLGMGSATLGGQSLHSYFTTYDGSAGEPRYDIVGGFYVFSSELSPVGGQNGSYRTDYVLFVNGLPDSWGTVSVSYPTNDSDSNGVPDYLQAGLSGTVSFTGSVVREVPSTSSPMAMSGQVTRLAGSTTGSYVASIQDPVAGLVTYGGASYLLNANGTFSYDRSGNTAQTTVVVANEDGTTTSYSGTSSTGFTVVNAETVSFSAGALNGPNGRTLRHLAYTLTRTGKRYVGTVQFQDGGLSTSWPDYVLWRIEITDNNDSDGDGIPDLSDNLPPIVPYENGQTVNGFQDDFTGATRNASWVAFGPGGDLYQQFDGLLHVSAHAGDPNHLLFTRPGYSNDVQEVLARIRVTAFGSDPIIGSDFPRGGISVGVQTDPENLSRGLNLLFRDSTQDAIPGRQFKFLDDLRAWGPAGLRTNVPGHSTPGWTNNVWYWTRLRLDPKADGVNDLFGKVWVADGVTREPSDWQLKWPDSLAVNNIPKPLRKGFAGIAASSGDGLAHLEVDYVLIKAAGLPQIAVSINPTGPPPTQLRFTGFARLPGDSLEIGWVGEGFLEQSESVTGPWTTATGRAGTGIIEFTGPRRFYRLHK